MEFVLVNDHSEDDTFEKIRKLSERYPFVKGVDLSRNFGQHNAIMAGLHYTSGEYIIGMDDDLQTHPSQIYKLLEKIEEGYDLVFGVEASNYWICRKFVRDELTKYSSYNLYLQVLFYQTSHHIGNVEVEHFSREEGTSNYNFWKLLGLFLTCLNYTVIPLRISTVFGCVFACGGFIGAIVTCIRKLLDPSIAVGWSSLMCSMFVFFGIVLLILGILGEYIGKIILNISGTPQYVVREELNIERGDDPV